MPPARCRAFRRGGQAYREVSPASWSARLEERGKKRISRFWRGSRVWKSCLLEMLAEIRRRSRVRRWTQWDSAAKLLTAKEDWGAMNSSTLPFNRPSSRAVRDLEELCTSSDMSRRRTKEARGECRIRAILEGHTVVMNCV